MISKRGRGAVRIAPGDPEYWIASSNPELDQPRRHAALRDTDGDAWQALTLLCDPAWHERYYRQASEARHDRGHARTQRATQAPQG